MCFIAAAPTILESQFGPSYLWIRVIGFIAFFEVLFFPLIRYTKIDNNLIIKIVVAETILGETGVSILSMA